MENNTSASSTSSNWTLRSVTKGFDKWIEKHDIPSNVIDMQKTALLGIARILRKVLEM